MWKTFKQVIDIVHPKFIKMYIHQALNHEDFLNLEPLFNAYLAYADKYWSSPEDNGLIRDNIDDWIREECVQLSKVMKKLVPMHMIMEMTKNMDESFIRKQFKDADPNNPPHLGFAVVEEMDDIGISLEFVRRVSLPNPHTNTQVPLSMEQLSGELEELVRFIQWNYYYGDWILTRGDYTVGATITKWAGSIPDDVDGFLLLQEHRKAEFFRMRTELIDIADLLNQAVTRITAIWLINEGRLPNEMIVPVVKMAMDDKTYSPVAPYITTEFILNVLKDCERFKIQKPEFLKRRKLNPDKTTAEQIAHAIWLGVDDKPSALSHYSCWAKLNNKPVEGKEVEVAFKNVYN